ncbi:MAG: hypothetical protein IJJ23_11695 [Clostridia bacterium]|nr:hypothetical protein [Clostridia bacterium]
MSGYYGSSYRYGAGTGAASVIILIISFGLGILMLAAQWRLFTKADEKGWKCLIPIYNAYTWFKITWDTSVFWKILGGGIAYSVLSGIIAAVASSNRGGFSVGTAIMGILGLAYIVAILVVDIKELIYTARSYGKDGTFAVGLFFLAIIFYPVLAFGDSQYVGPKGIPYSANSRLYSDDANASGESSTSKDTALPYHGAPSPAASNPNMIWVIVGVCALILCAGFVPRIVMSMTNFKLMRGMFGSEWVGFRNFEYLFADSNLSAVIRNSVIFGIVRVIVAFLFSLLGGTVGMSDSKAAKAVMASIGAVIAFIPTVAYEYILVALRLTASAGLNILIPLVYALPVGGVAMMLGALLPSVWPQNRFSGVLIAPLLTLTFFFFDRSYIGTLLQNALNMRNTNTIVSYSYRLSIIQMQLSSGAAAELIQSLVNLIPGLIGALMIGTLVKKTSKPAVAPSQRGNGASVAGVLALVCTLIAGTGLILFYPAVFREENVISTVLVSLLYAVLTAILAFGAYYVVLLCAGKFDSRRWVPFSLLVLLTVLFNRLSIADYLTARNLGLFNTIIMPVLYGVVNPLSIMLILGAMILRPQRTSSCVMFALGAALLSAAYVTGDVSSFMIYINNQGGWNLGMLARRITINSAAVVSEGVEPQTAANIGYSVIGVALITAAVPIGLGAALFVSAAQRES